MTILITVSLLLAAIFGILWWQGRNRLMELQDRTARQKRDDEVFMKRSQRRAEMLHRLVDGIDDGLFIVGSDLRVIFSNRRALSFFPPINEPSGKPLIECIRDHRMVEVVSASAQDGMRGREEFLVAASGVSQGIEDRVYSIEAIPLSQNEPAGLDGAVLVILRDETSKHNLEKIRKDFVANASHELRTPLSIIIGYLENLKDGDITGATEMSRVFSIMKKHGDRLASIVEDLLVISRMESGQTDTLSLEEFDFQTCAQDVVHRLSPMVGSTGARTSVSVTDDASPQLFGDRFYWDQILFNLVSNALKENQSTSGLRIGIKLTQEGDTSIIEVRDNGVGIPHADLPFVFKRFYRVARHHSKEIKGTGLGLSIVKRAVEAHKGTITVHSKPGMETVFTMRIPRKKGAH